LLTEKRAIIFDGPFFVEIWTLPSWSAVRAKPACMKISGAT